MGLQVMLQIQVTQIFTALARQAVHQALQSGLHNIQIHI